jgi:hypothetical protein
LELAGHGASLGPVGLECAAHLAHTRSATASRRDPQASDRSSVRREVRDVVDLYVARPERAAGEKLLGRIRIGDHITNNANAMVLCR